MCVAEPGAVHDSNPPPPTIPAPPTTSGPTSVPPTGGTFDETDVPIPDQGTIESSIVVTGRTGKAPGALRVTVRIVHSHRGDLGAGLVAPDGRVYRIKVPAPYDRAANFDVVATVNAAASPLAEPGRCGSATCSPGTPGSSTAGARPLVIGSRRTRRGTVRREPATPRSGPDCFRLQGVGPTP